MKIHIADGLQYIQDIAKAQTHGMFYTLSCLCFVVELLVGMYVPAALLTSSFFSHCSWLS